MIWIIMIVTGLLTFAMRFVMLSGVAPRKLPAAFGEALGFVPIAVLTAIITPAVLMGEASNCTLFAYFLHVFCICSVFPPGLLCVSFPHFFCILPLPNICRL